MSKIEKEDLPPQQDEKEEPPKTESGNSDKDLSSVIVPVESPILQAERNLQHTNSNLGIPQVESNRLNQMLSDSNNDNKTQCYGNQESFEAPTEIGLIVKLYKEPHRYHNYGLIWTKNKCYGIDYQRNLPIPAWVKFVVPEENEGVKNILSIVETGWSAGWERDTLKNKVIAVKGELMLHSFYYDRTDCYKYYIHELLGQVKVGKKHYDTQPPVSCIYATLYYTRKNISVIGRGLCWWYVESSTPIYDGQDMKASKKVDDFDQIFHFDRMKQNLEPNSGTWGSKVAQSNNNSVPKPIPFANRSVAPNKTIAVTNPIGAESKCSQGMSVPNDENSATREQSRKNEVDVISAPHPMQFNQKNESGKGVSIQAAYESKGNKDTKKSDVYIIQKKSLIDQLTMPGENREMAINAFIEIAKDVMKEYNKLAEEMKKIQKLETTGEIGAGIERIPSAKSLDSKNIVRKRGGKASDTKSENRNISHNEKCAS
ncbi:hypothetical protein GCK72_022302 [Caenorhabditis remanei]|uniref:Uncharacterized protein n=1 Tax=Caenorhabditis remanei TaxID=31234 RepID=A0A6A5FTN0_CAERE|nr:hypothetical protein GCK72_022302 [Caenorhabditis remanei]KAF1745855.1 hypothetical protein GCK72_022302 [Caenorhabditis remanei]